MRSSIELEKEWAKADAKRREEMRSNPLIQYSTGELKRELRRRKREGN